MIHYYSAFALDRLNGLVGGIYSLINIFNRDSMINGESSLLSIRTRHFVTLHAFRKVCQGKGFCSADDVTNELCGVYGEEDLTNCTVF